MADASLVFNIIGRDRLGPALAQAKAEALAASDGVKSSMGKLDTQIRDTEASVAALKQKFVETGDVDLLKDLRKEGKTLEGLRKVRAELESLSKIDTRGNRGLLDFAIDEAVVRGFRAAKDKVSEGMTSLGDSIAHNPIISTAIIGVLVAMSPYIVSALSLAVGAGLALGFSGGVIALGLSRAIADSRVNIAADRLGHVVTESLDTSSGRFVQPLINGLGKVQDAWSRLAPHIDHSMAALTPAVDALFEGAAGFMDAIGPGLDALSNVGSILAQDFASWLPDLGDAFTRLFQTIEQNGPTIQRLFDDIMEFAVGAIDALGWLIDKGSAVYNVFQGLNHVLLGDFAGGFDLIANANQKADANMSRFHNTTINTKDVLGLLNGTLGANEQGTISAANAIGHFADKQVDATTLASTYMNTLMSLDQAELGFHQSLTQVSEQTGRWSGQLDIATAKGQQHRQVVLGAVQANIQQYQAMLQAGLGADAASRAYDSNTSALESQLHKLGLTQGEIDELIGKYRGVPHSVDTNIELHGLAEAISGLDATLRRINGLPDKTVTVTIDYVSRGNGYGYGAPAAGQPAPRGGTYGARAGGGPVSTGQPYIVGEEGPELIYPTGPGQVIPHRESMAMLRGANSGAAISSAGASGGPVTVNVYAMSSGPQVGAQVVEAISAYEKANGAGWRS